MVLPMPPPVPAPEVRPATAEQGSRITLAGLEIEAPWQWVGDSRQHPAELWLTLDVLTGRFGFQRQPGLNGEELHWYGQQQRLQTIPTRTLDDEVAIDVSPWLRRVGVQMRQSGNGLSIDLPAPRLLNLRQGKGSTANRLVMDLSGPALLQRDGDDLLLSLRSTPTQDGQLRALGLRPWRRRDHLRLRGQGSRLSTLTLATPWRVVLDGVGSAANRAGTNATSEQKALQSSLLNPVVQGLLRQGLVLDRRTVTVGVKPLIVYRSARIPASKVCRCSPSHPAGDNRGCAFSTSSPDPTRPFLPTTVVSSIASDSCHWERSSAMASGCQARFSIVAPSAGQPINACCSGACGWIRSYASRVGGDGG